MSMKYPKINVISGPASEREVRDRVEQYGYDLGTVGYSQDYPDEKLVELYLCSDALENYRALDALFTRLCQDTDWHIQLDWDDLDTMVTDFPYRSLERPTGGETQDLWPDD